MENEELQEILVTAQRKYPGRSWDQLSEEERDAVFASYEGRRAMAGDLTAQGQATLQGATKRVGPSGITVNNPFEALAGGVMAGIGYGMQGRANREERMGREANADLITNRDARDRVYYDQRAAEEERRRREWLSQILRKN